MTTLTLNKTTMTDYKRIVGNTKRFNRGLVTSKSNGNNTCFFTKSTGKLIRSITFSNNKIEVVTY